MDRQHRIGTRRHRPRRLGQLISSRAVLSSRTQFPYKANRQKLDIRTALLMLLAQHIALADAALLYAAHQATPLIAISAAVAFVAAYRWFDSLIELRPG